ncbi:ABC transporter ATP-binding protein [Jiangella aurantiaca]|uniref:ABC transporter ATP-binding protein n=1 Tax=Jiangella aurantiaca TaxID=2530373 RepID=A0A4R4ZZE0_9ACTN|nr:ABC transporter ATP-binding protein [Jiangella aurantiaca]TDD64030.1 ABC transporter ATP-binding protein [Jiangella aurantiaca]
MSRHTTAPVLVADRVSVGYGRPPRHARAVLTGIDATLHAGELACLVGPNGAGKSTLLRSLARFQPLLAGDVRVDGVSIAGYTARDLARKIAVVLTDRVAAGQLRAYDVVALGRYPHTGWAGRLDRDDHAVVDRCLTDTGATHLADRPMSELSDGERQRIMIARALAQEPHALLLDEPSAFLDVRGRLELTTLLLSLTHDHGLAVLMSTHDLEHMMRHADQVWLVTGGGLRVGAPEDLGLDGSLQRALAGDAVFDPVTGAFQTGRRPTGRVRLIGDGATMHWTRRALDRAGYLAADDATIDVICVSGNGQPAWLLRGDGRQHTADSLAALVALLRRPD